MSIHLDALSGWNVSVLVLLVKATLILIAALGITLSMQKASATARHLVWLVTLGMLLLVPVLTAWAPIRIAVLPAAQEAVKRHIDAGQAADVQQSLKVNDAPASSGAPNAAVPQSGSSASPGVVAALSNRISAMNTVTLVGTVWGIVAGIILLSLAWAGTSVRRIVKVARPLTSPDWQTPLYEIADRLGLDNAPVLLQSDTAKMPFACGVFSPTIVLPAESEAWSLDRRRAVLLHELAHVRRRDLVGHTLGRFACAAYWFHPLVWTAAKQLRSESERACDDLALSCGTRATDYAEHLLDIVTSVRGDATPLVALAMARRKEFEGRMLAILDPHLKHSTPSRRQAGALIAVLALISVTIGAVSPVAREAQAATVAADHVTTPNSQVAERASIPGASLTTPRPDKSGRKDSADKCVGVDCDVHLSVPITLPGSGGAAASAAASATASASASASPTVSTSMSMRMDTRVNTQTNVVTSGDIAVQRLAEAGKQYGIGMANTVLQALAGKGAKGDKDDDRPALLAKVLRTDTSATLRRIAAWGLHEFTDAPVASDALVNALRKDTDGNVREMAAWALADGRGQTNTVEALSSALKGDANYRVRSTAAWALGELGDKSAASGLVSALSDTSANIRMRAAWALGNIETDAAPKALLTLLRDKEPRVRKMAAWALYQIEDPSAASALDAALKVEEDKDIQLAEIRALAALGDKSVDAIKGLLDSSDPKVRQMAVRALAGGHAAGPWPMPWPEPRPFP